MGRGIVQLFAQAGYQIVNFDAQTGAAQSAVAQVREQFARNVEKGRMTAADADRFGQAMRPAGDLNELSGCELVIEAIIEDLDAKRALFKNLEAVVAPDAILASNTSSLTVADIAAACSAPERVAGLHFFNPVPLMKVVEVIAAVRTSPATVETLRLVTQSAGHRAVVAADQPGFLVNHAGRGLYTEGLRIVEEGVASPSDVDDVLREAMGFRMGPFELLDLTGLDVSGRVMNSIYEQFQHEPRFRPSTLVPPRIAAGMYGRKSGEGWYCYANDKKVTAPLRATANSQPGLQVWLEPDADSTTWLPLLTTAEATQVGNPAVADLCIVQPWGKDATSAALEYSLDPSRCIAVDPLPPFGLRRTLMLTAVTRAQAREAAVALLSADGVPVTVINDSHGFITQRVIATIVNIAANISQRRIASVDDLEDAVKLGLGYPQGPLAWGDKIGAARIRGILQAQQRGTGDPRYRPSPWLIRRVELGLSLTTPEAAR